LKLHAWVISILVVAVGAIGFAVASGMSATHPRAAEPTSIPETSTLSTTSTTTTGTTTAKTGRVLPNRELTPGVLNPKVRQSTIRKTICRARWTQSIRPPLSYTNRLKVEQMAQYGETGSPAAYEEDHLIPLELGGAPRNPKNLWPEPHAQSRVSDPLETALKREVCHALMSLKKARSTIRAFKFANG
jgi:hypothetical protein